MKDTEWEAWRSKWTGTEGPLPDVRARAVQQASRHRRANRVLFALIAGGALVDLWALIFEEADPILCWALILWGAGVSIGFAWIQRGIRLGEAANPREAVAFLEQRVRVERQGAQLLRWAYAVGTICVAIYFRDLFEADNWPAKLVLRTLTFAAFAMTFSAPWWMRRFTRRQQAEIDLWRRWIDEQQL